MVSCKMRYLFILTGLFIISSCSQSSRNSHDVPKVTINIDRLEEKLMSCDTRADIKEFLNENPHLASTFFGVPTGISDSILIEGLYTLIADPGFDSLYQEVLLRFSSISSLEKDLETAFSNLRYHYPGAKVPEVKTMISGISNDLFISDSLIIVGLDFYLGKEAKYRPLGYPDYIRKRFEKEYLVPSIMLFLSDLYSKTDYSDKTLLADMIYYGKAYAFAREMFPQASDSLIIWYDGKEIFDVKRHEDVVWAHFIQNELLYETNPRVKDKYLGERPKTLEIGNECPGRVGAWLGWEIVKRYQKSNPDFKELMQKSNATEILRSSRYKPNPN